MSKPDDEKEVLEEEDEVLIEDEEDEDEDEELEIDLDEEDEQQKRRDKERNSAFASMRVENKKLQEQINQMQQQVQQLNAPKPAPKPDSSYAVDGIPRTDEEWDDLADKDWKKAVDLRAHMNAQKVLSTQKEASNAANELEKSKQRVLERHPELNDNGSEKSRIFLQILNNNPDYINHPKGPIYAMRDMEDHMETVLGYKKEDIVSAERNGAKKESERQHRIILNKGGGKPQPNGKNTVTLSKEEAEFCKLQGLDPKEFARNKKKLSKSGKEGVSV